MLKINNEEGPWKYEKKEADHMWESSNTGQLATQQKPYRTGKTGISCLKY
jgi:hypothetical protein